MKRSDILKKIGVPVPDAARLRVVVDTDAKNEADDQYAIMHHLLSPILDVRGIVAAHFEQKAGCTGESMEKSYQEIRRLLSLAQMEDVPCFRGCVHPLSGPDAMPDAEGVHFLIDEARKPGRLYVAVLGAMTNVAAALNAAPDIASNVTVLWNGGASCAARHREFNVMQDPEAARAMLRSAAEVWQTPMEVYGTLEVSLAELKRRVYPCGAIGRYLFEQLVEECFVEFSPDFPLRTGENWTLGDNTTAAVLLMSRLRGNYHTEPAPLLNDDLTFSPNPSGRPIRVYDFIDVRFTLEDLFSKLELAYRD